MQQNKTLWPQVSPDQKRLPMPKAAVTRQRHSSQDSTHSYAPSPTESRSYGFHLSHVLLKTPSGITASYIYCSLICIWCQTCVKFFVYCSLRTLCWLDFIERDWLIVRPRQSVWTSAELKLFFFYFFFISSSSSYLHRDSTSCLWSRRICWHNHHDKFTPGLPKQRSTEANASRREQ